VNLLDPLERIEHLGFTHCGSWFLDDHDELDLKLDLVPDGRNVLYAFVANGGVLYVGKTVQGLAKRLYGYKRPGATQTTNIRANALIREQLPASSVEVFVWPCDGLMTYAGFRVDLAAGLEDAIVHDLQPAWNKRK
jgi:hypothetical protein